MRALNEAFGVLGSVSRREAYDRQRLIRIRTEYVSTRDARDQSSNPCGPANAPGRSTISDMRGAQGPTPTSDAHKATAGHASPKRRQGSKRPRAGKQHARGVPTYGPNDEPGATEHARTRSRSRPRRTIRTVNSRSVVVKLIDLAARALETLRYRVNRSGISTSRRLLGIRIRGIPASRLPMISTWHAGLVASVGVAIFATMGIGSMIAEVFQPNAQLQSNDVVEARLVVVNSKSLTVPTQIVMRRPVATPNVWPPIASVESRSSDEVATPVHSESSMHIVIDVERTTEVRINEAVTPTETITTLEVQPNRSDPRGMFGLLRSAATALGNRTIGPRRPVPPNAPSVAMGQ